MELDALDKKILAVLDEDARLAEAAIGKKVGTSKQVVRYRLNRLKEEGIVENYYTMLDVGKLGFDSYYVFVQLTGLNLDEENEIYKKILKLPHIAWLITGVGRWDAVLLFCSKTIAQFNEQLEGLKRLFGKHLHEYTFTTLIQAEHVSYKFVRPSTQESLKTTPKNKIQTLDNIDKTILRTLNQSARMPVTELSEITKHPLYTVHHRLKQLKKEKIIQGFRPKINVHKLGIQWHLLLIKFKSVSEERANKFIEYCKNNKYVYYVTNTVGLYNVMLDVHVKNTEEFRDFLFDIKNSFGDVILLYESVVVFEEKILTYIPPIVLSDSGQGST
ncbi:MAG: winged helix-turn-helix transcriptional regulator [Nanoarchaeota archaeon]